MSAAAYLRHPRRLARKAQWALLHRGPRRDITVDGYNGRLTFDSRDRLIGKRLFVDRAYERGYIESALGTLVGGGYLDRSGRGTVLDIGANLGMIAIALLRHGWFAGAIAVEPAPAAVRLLEHNVAQNGLGDRVRCVAAALSSSPGERLLEISSFNSGDNRIRRDARSGAWREEERETIAVPVRTLDGLFDHGAHDRAYDDIRLVWMDVQGHEAQCLAGGATFLTRGVPVVTEFWPYGIERSGITAAEYERTLAVSFTHFYRIERAGTTRHDIGAIGALFAELARPKQMAQLVLVRRR